jgi:hypothetical protein
VNWTAGYLSLMIPKSSISEVSGAEKCQQSTLRELIPFSLISAHIRRF